MLSILHVFENYLPKSEAWLHLLLSNMTGVNQKYVSLNYLENEFLDVDKVLGLDYSTIRDFELSFSLRNRVSRKISKIIRGPTQKSRIQKLILDSEFDIIHFHFSSIACDFLNEIPQTKSKVFVSFYGYDYERLPNNFPRYKDLYVKLLATRSFFLTEGNFGKEKLISLGGSKDQVFVQRLGVDVSTIKIHRRKKIKNHLRLLQIADFRPKKGHIDAVTAVHLAIQNCPNIYMKIVGRAQNKKCYDEVIEYIRINNLSELIEVEMWVDYSKLHSFMNNYDVFIHPSKYSFDRDCEGGAPIIILDAQATGMPIISTSHCDIPEEVLHNRTGLLIEEGNVTELSHAIQTFYNMEEFTFQEYCLKARRHVESNYNIRRNSKELLEKYRNLNFS